MRIPEKLLRRLYTVGSLANIEGGIRFSIKNRLLDVELTRLLDLHIDGASVPSDAVTLRLGDGRSIGGAEVRPDAPTKFPLRQVAEVCARRDPLGSGVHEIRMRFEARPFGTLEVSATDAVSADGRAAPSDDGDADADAPPATATHIPFEHVDTLNYAPDMVAHRRAMIEQLTGAKLEHVGRFSFEPMAARGHAENFVGVAQIPLGFAGPVRINGEHANGEFVVPLATSEGTLVASYSRGMKVLTLAGGVTVTVTDDAMQRAPVFIFPSAREARDFRRWLAEHIDDVRRETEATSHVAKLLHIETYLASRMAFTRFNFSTGEAAGQNMVTRATYAGAAWIAEHAPCVERFYLESNLATDKKPSAINTLHGRGKRVIAEATIARELLEQHLHASPESLHLHNEVANIGAFLSGVNNNGLHSVNGITALFIATGQDVANVAEATAATGHTELRPDGALYMSVTIPSLIVATHGGGTGLPTQHECLAALGCTGEPGSALKLAEIVGATVLAGEISLAAAISSLEWVTAHERYGRHR